MRCVVAVERCGESSLAPKGRGSQVSRGLDVVLRSMGEGETASAHMSCSYANAAYACELRVTLHEVHRQQILYEGGVVRTRVGQGGAALAGAPTLPITLSPGDVRVSGRANTSCWVLRDTARPCFGTPSAVARQAPLTDCPYTKLHIPSGYATSLIHTWDVCSGGCNCGGGGGGCGHPGAIRGAAENGGASGRRVERHGAVQSPHELHGAPPQPWSPWSSIEHTHIVCVGGAKLNQSTIWFARIPQPSPLYLGSLENANSPPRHG